MTNNTRRRVFISCLLLGGANAGCAIRLSPALRSRASGAAPAIIKRASTSGVQSAWHETFDRLDFKQWREIDVKRHSTYHVTVLEGRPCLEALSHDSASILVHKISVDVSVSPWLSWQWRVDHFVEGEDLYRKAGSDASARVYVYFDTRGLPWQKRSIDYVWSAHLPVNTVLDSPFSSSSKIVIAASGVENRGRWIQQERNLYEDYKLCYHAEPPRVAAIGLMTDTDSAGGYGLAYYDDLTIRAEK